MAARGQTVAVDSNAVVALFAEANCRAYGTRSQRVQVTNAEDFSPDDVAAWHIDPDRRTSGRTTRIENFQPNIDQLDRLLYANAHAAVKLAPATELPPHWAASAEREWIGWRGECKQQVAWFGNLARHSGQKSATVLDRDCTERTVVGDGTEALETSGRVMRYLYEPQAAVLAAGLTAALAQLHDLAALGHGIAYLTSETAITDPALAGFEVREVLPLDLKRLKRLLREKEIGELEVKRRGVEVDPHELAKKLRVKGRQRATLLVAPMAGAVTAILARRVVQG